MSLLHVPSIVQSQYTNGTFGGPIYGLIYHSNPAWGHLQVHQHIIIFIVSVTTTTEATLFWRPRHARSTKYDLEGATSDHVSTTCLGSACEPARCLHVCLWLFAQITMHCYTDGKLDTTKFMQMRKHERDLDFDQMAEMLLSSGDNAFTSNDTPLPEEKKKRRKRIILARRTDDGKLEELPPTESMWYHLYVSCPNVSDKQFQQSFCRRFVYHTTLTCSLWKMPGTRIGFRGRQDATAPECPRLLLSS